MRDAQRGAVERARQISRSDRALRPAAANALPEISLINLHLLRWGDASAALIQV